MRKPKPPDPNDAFAAIAQELARQALLHLD
jgi:hypothetical protein